MKDELGELSKEEALKSYRRYMLRLKERIYQEELRISQGEEIELSYLAPSIYSLYDMLIRYDQFQDVELPEGLNYIKSSQVIRLKTFLPKEILEMKDPERVVSAGMFLVVDVYFLRGELLRSAEGSGKGKGFSTNPDIGPEKYGLPSGEHVNYSTRMRLSGDIYVALCAEHWISDYINNTFHYEYPTLCLKGVDNIMTEYSYAEKEGFARDEKSNKDI